MVQTTITKQPRKEYPKLMTMEDGQYDIIIMALGYIINPTNITVEGIILALNHPYDIKYVIGDKVEFNLGDLKDFNGVITLKNK